MIDEKKIIKLTLEQFKNSLKNRDLDHFWVYNYDVMYQRNINDNGISLNRYNKKPSLCLVIENGRSLYGINLQAFFGEGAFLNGGVSDDEKENMTCEVYYIKKIKLGY